MPISAIEFVRKLRDFKLLEEAELRSLRRSIAENETADAASLAKSLVKQGKLTRYQAAAIYQQKTRHLVMGDYQIQERIGKGGMGQVFRAVHRRLDRTVALKVLHDHLVGSSDAVNRFKREVRAAACLDHPNVVTAYDADESKGMHFLVTEFVQGHDLHSIIADQGPLPIDVAISYLKQAAEGLSYAHSEGVIHRDIKPSNLLVDLTGRLKILDMGLARRQSEPDSSLAGLTRAGQIMGTLEYMAPEQAQDTHAADARSDIYALGGTLHRMITGSVPFKGNTVVEYILAHREAPTPSLREQRSEVPRRLEQIYYKMMEKSPADRYQSVAELLLDLHDLDLDLDESDTSTISYANETNEDLRGFLNTMAIDTPTFTASDESTSSKSNAGRPTTRTKLAPRKSASGKRIWLVGIAIAIVAVGVFVRMRKREPDTTKKVSKDSRQTVNPDTVLDERQNKTQRDIATQLLKYGGRLIIDTGNGRHDIHNATQLPPGEFTVDEAYFTSPQFYEHKVIDRLADLTTLQRLHFVHVPVTDLDLAKLSQIESLEELYLYATNVTSKGLSQLAKLPRLGSLLLRSSLFADDVLAPIARLKTLNKLSIVNTYVTGVGLDKLNDMPLLTSLIVDKSPLKSSSLASFSPPALKRLTLSGTRVDDEGVRHLARLQQLERLSLVGSEFTRQSLVHLKQSNVVGLTIRSPMITSADLAELSTMRLQRLSVGGPSIDDRLFDSIAPLTELIELGLTNSAVTTAAIDKLAAMSSLKRVVASNSAIEAKGLRKLRKKRPDLEIVGKGCDHELAERLVSLGGEIRVKVGEVIHNMKPGQSISDFGPEATFAGVRLDKDMLTGPLPQNLSTLLSQVKDLESIVTSVPFHDKDLIPLTALPNLRRLYLTSFNVTDAGLATLSKMNRLTEVLLSLPRITNRGVAMLTQLKEVWRLTIICRAITNAATAGLATMKSVTHLSLYGCSIDDDGMIEIAKMKQLRFLGLHATKVTDDGLRYIKELPVVEMLDLSSTKVKGPGLAHITEWKHLFHLILSDTEVDDGIVPHVLQFKQLRRVHLRKTKVTEESLNRLRKVVTVNLTS